MFTGIIEDLGIIKKINKNQLTVTTKLDGIKLGDSICINGVCLTTTHCSPASPSSGGLLTAHCSLIKADISAETLKRTNLGMLKPGDKVNLERAMKTDGRFGGHFVTGHIDGIGKIKKLERLKNFKVMKFSVPESLSKHIVEKGSIAIDGISLTVSAVTQLTAHLPRRRQAGYCLLTVSVIPYTLKNTTLDMKKAGDTVNIETDILSKYVLKSPEKKEITIEMLRKAGF
ncbi:MAG: riboflavin synthase [Elusimicrobia bacterium]|nr:riboflavin synthase [Elusimicrobiota bacterium]